MIDPRTAVVPRRFSGIGRIIGFSSGKGGVGKSTCASIAGMVLAQAGRRVGILDCDLQGASVHVFLGVGLRFPEEEKGLLPIPVADNLGLMSAALFAGDRALALRGPDISNALLEMVAVTRWGKLDYLLIDLPPGMGEEVLDLSRLVPRMEALVVTTSETVCLSVVNRMIGFLHAMRVPLIGVIANMTRGDADRVRAMSARADVTVIGELPFDPGLERAIGDPIRLARTQTASVLKSVLESVSIS